MAETVIGTLKYSLFMPNTKQSGVQIQGIGIPMGQSQAKKPGIYSLVFTDQRIIGVNITDQAATMVGGKTQQAENTLGGGLLGAIMPGLGVMSSEIVWVNLKKIIQGKEDVDYTASEVTDAMNGTQDIHIPYDTIQEIKLSKLSPFGKSDFVLQLKLGMMHWVTFQIDAPVADQLKALIQKSPASSKLK